ncbi:hypothetical protein CEXT_531 [Caerostris extrusa]|uniref:Uncharacterized protein n=1 Tax=Caerostris extrusa TaxID=172846 RepID=A0AAV4S5X8_CAEEX|nr:hypothetical protein CEXT_531 [Caerostris extrusa]
MTETIRVFNGFDNFQIEEYLNGTDVLHSMVLLQINKTVANRTGESLTIWVDEHNNNVFKRRNCPVPFPSVIFGSVKLIPREERLNETREKPQSAFPSKSVFQRVPQSLKHPCFATAEELRKQHSKKRKFTFLSTFLWANGFAPPFLHSGRSQDHPLYPRSGVNDYLNGCWTLFILELIRKIKTKPTSIKIYYIFPNTTIVEIINWL